VRAQRTLQLLERNAAEARRRGEIRIIGGRKAYLGQAQQILIADELGGAGGEANFQIGRCHTRG
jgi:hypothetical protein